MPAEPFRLYELVWWHRRGGPSRVVVYLGMLDPERADIMYREGRFLYQHGVRVERLTKKKEA